MANFYLFCATFCVLISYFGAECKFNIFCKVPKDCEVINTLCEDHVCKCPAGQIFNTDFTKCLSIASSPEYSCEDDKQCTEWMSGPVTCNKKQCVCETGYRYHNEMCIIIKKLNETCTRDEECDNSIFSGATKCDEGKCICGANFYNRENIDCRPISKEGEDCILNIDCAVSKNCVQGKCNSKKIITSFQNIRDNLLDTPATSLNIPCASDSDCEIVNKSYCAVKFNRCVCDRTHVYDKKSGNCIPAIDAKCEETCIKNAKCNSELNICQCNKYFIKGNLNEKCHKPAKQLGESCTDTRSCYTFGINAVCEDRQCQCNSRSTFDKDLMLCRLTENSNSMCPTDCSLTENAICVDHTCVCKDGYHLKQDMCLPNIGTECSRTEDCDGDKIKCAENKCACDDGYIQNGPIDCLKEAENSDDSCQIDGQCKNMLGNGGICFNELCQCSVDYTLQNNTCLEKKYVGDSCNARKECHVINTSEHVICLKNKCVCDYGYRSTKYGTDCISINNSNGGSSVSKNGFLFLLLSMIVLKQMLAYR